MKTVRKAVDIVVLITEFAPAALIIVTGLGFIVGGATGVLWY